MKEIYFPRLYIQHFGISPDEPLKIFKQLQIARLWYIIHLVKKIKKHPQVANSPQNC